MTEKTNASDKPAAALHAACVQYDRLLALVSDAVLKLNIARKNRLIYPAEHDQAHHSLQRAWEGLRQAVEQISPLTLTVMPDGFTLGSDPLPTTSNAFREMAPAMKQRGIAAVTFEKGVSAQELGRFVELIILEAEQMKDRGGIVSAAAEQGLRCIHLHAVDYARFQVTEESVIHRPSKEPQGGTLWGRFVAQLLDGTPAAEGRCGEAGLDSFDASQMAALLNAHQADGDKGRSLYAAMIAEYLQSATASGPEASPAVMGLDHFHRLIAELNPELQRQFLSITYDHCVRQDASQGLSGLIGGMQTELVVQMLRRANLQGKQISPSLMAFVRKLGLQSEISGETGGIFSAKDAHDELQPLLAREDYETYVDDAYGRLLDRMTESRPHQETFDAFTALKTEVEGDLEESKIASRVSLALKGLMAESIDLEEYRDWARQLTFFLDVLITQHNYQALSVIHDFIVRQNREADSPDHKKVSQLVLDHFASGPFLNSAISSGNRPADRIDAQLVSLLGRIGDAAVAEIVESIGGGAPFDEGSMHHTFLSQFSTQAVAEALERVRDPRPVFVCRMLNIVRQFGCDQDAERVKSLLDHGNFRIRMEALATMLHFGNPWGGLRLRDMLTGQWSDTMRQAVDVAGKCKVKDAVPILLGFVRRPGPLGPDIQRREAALRALGQIGDVQVLPELSKMVHRRWSLSRKHLNHLKRVFFESLGGYPLEAVRELVYFGLRHKDRHINETCEQLMRRGRRHFAGEDRSQSHRRR